MAEKIIARIEEYWKTFRSRVSTAFLISLGLSLIFWYSGKLQYTYTTEIPMNVVIEGEKYRVTCVVEGTGHNILSARYFGRRTVKLNPAEITTVAIEGEEGARMITPESLQSAIALRYSEIKINSVHSGIVLK